MYFTGANPAGDSSFFVAQNRMIQFNVKLTNKKHTCTILRAS